MSIVLLRNMLNQEMKSFGGFLNPIQNTCKLSGIESKIIYSPLKTEYLESFNSGDTFIIVAHGSPETIYHRFDHTLFQRHQILVDTNNLTQLKGMKIIAISCACARTLGPESVSSGDCKVFLGFENAIHFDKKDKTKAVCKYYDRYIRNIYKSVFENVLSKGIIENWTFEKISKVLEWELKKEAARAAQAEKKKSETAYFSREIEETIIAIANVASSIRVFGKID
ncbi:hypothetical protein FIV78_15320, partial [Listeria monocytogenes]|nr:hypothetical protein [Listeria monocytogenes]EBF6236002.1 hypothetical protein [Listeria monocytogenes]